MRSGPSLATSLVASFLTILASTCLLARAKADDRALLFLDTNNGTGEITAARRAAAARGMELVVVPELADEQRERIARLQRQREKLGQAPSTDKTQQQLQDIETELKKTQLSGLRFQQSVQAALILLKQRGKTVADLVISGHGDGCWFSGDVGSVSRFFLRDVLKDPKFNLSRSLKGVYLWGCYGVTLKHGPDWRADFPTSNIVAGFDDSGASSTFSASQNYLEKVIEMEDALSTESDAKRVLQFMTDIGAVPIMNAAIYTGCVYVSPRWAIPSGEIAARTCSPSIRRQVESLLPEFIRYKNAADSGHEQVPADTQNSRLRDLYTALRNTTHCDFAKSLPSPDQVLRLIFFRQVVQSFGKWYAKNLEQGRSEITTEMMDARFIPDFNDPSLTRAQILAKIDKLESYLANGYGLARRNPGRYRSMLKVEKVLHHLKTLNCIPFNWVEPGSGRDTLTPPSEQCDDHDDYVEACNG